MKRITTATGFLTLVAMFVLGVFSVGSASAVPQFLWTGPLPGLVLIKSDNPQFFSSAPGFTVVCQKFTGHGFASNGLAMTTKDITITGVYAECKTVLPLALAAEVTPAAYLLNADGSLAVLNEITINIPGAGCNLKIKPGGANASLKTIRYLTDPLNAGAILAHAEVTKIASFGSAEPCGTAGVEKTEGEYRGLLLAFIHGGTLKWDA